MVRPTLLINFPAHNGQLTDRQAGMFLTARLGSGLVVGRLPNSYDDDGDDDDGGGGGGSGRGDDTPSQQRRRRAKQRGLPRWSAPSAITCSGVGYGFQMGAEVRWICGSMDASFDRQTTLLTTLRRTQHVHPSS